MKVLGLVVEYNPFHNGHKYHLEKSREITGCDAVVGIMSGNFVQRGEPAIVNKWARAKMALMSGVDLVIENPCIYAVSSAEFFAYSAVKLLDSLGIVNYISFGSESGNIDDLLIAADLLNNENEFFKGQLKSYLDLGLSFPAARQAAFGEYIHKFGLPDIEHILNSSNNILAIEYLKALKKIKSNIIPYTIKRVNNDYKDSKLTGNISSATSIRYHIKSLLLNENSAKKSKLTGLEVVMPIKCIHILKDEFAIGRGPIFTESYESVFLSIIRKSSADQIKRLHEVSEGLENRIKNAADISGDYNSLIHAICTKRYPTTRIKRILYYLMIGLSKTTFNYFDGPPYIRVLGFNSKGKELLNKIGKKSTLPLITNTAAIDRSNDPKIKKMFELENLSTDLYVLGYSSIQHRLSGQEYKNSLVIL